jgi:8-oxo-dGTP pyrophosphatase MutT (NUDIX family)
MSVIQTIKRHLGLEPIKEKLQRFEEIQKSFTESDLRLDELAKDFFIEKSNYEARMKEPDNFVIQDKIQEKFDTFIKGHKESIRKAKKQYDSLKKEKDDIEKAFSNHKYIRKEPDGKGGWNYVYEEEHKRNLTDLEKYWVDDLKKLKEEKDKIDTEYNYKRTSLELVDILSNQMNYPKIKWEDSMVTSGKWGETAKREGKPIFDKGDIERFLEFKKGRFEGAIKSAKETFKELKEDVVTGDIAKEDYDKILKKFNDIVKEYSKWRLESIKLKEPYLQESYGYDFSKSVLGDFGDECISIIEGALKNKKETAYSKIKKAYQHGQISLDSFNTIIKGLTNDNKTKYSDFLLFNENGEILLLKRSSWEDDNAGAWVIPGGHVDPGEDFKTAAIRELQEESGYNVEDVENVGSYEDDKCHIEYFQAYVDTKEKPILLQFSEARDAKWIPVNEICEEAMVFNMRDNILRILGMSTEDQDRNKKIIRKAILAGIIPIEKAIDKYKLKLERLEARRTDKQYTKEKADYVDDFVEGDHSEENSCDRCSYYRPKEKDNCLKVKGEVSHNGHCKFWEHSNTDKSLQNHIKKAYLAGFISDDLIEKAWKKQPIGTVTTRKDGQQYRKVAETGDMDKDWKLVSKDKAESEKPESKGNKQSKEVKGGDKPIDSKELEIHAKNASESTLQAAIKESADENVRTAAHNEIDRREKEEKPQEKGGEKKENKVSPQDKFAKETGKDYIKESVAKLPSIYADKYDLKSGELKSISLDKLKPTQEGEDRINASSEAEAEVMRQFLDGEIEASDVRAEDFYPILIDANTMEILDGNHRFSAYEMLGLKKVNVVMLQPKEKEEKPIKKAEEDELKGGKADNETIQSLAEKHKVEVDQIKDQLKLGISIEMEHTDNPKEAVEIAMDHIFESAEYYTKLKEMESEMKSTDEK